MRGLALLIVLPVAVRADDAEFFEKKIRPVLAEHCFKCHSKDAEKLRGGLRLDNRELLLQGGDSGPAIVPGNVKKSRLLDAVGYANVDLQMPPAGKLPANVIADLETWIKNGAVWPGEESAATAKSTFDLAKRKAEHWAWQPVRPQTPSAVRNNSWVRDPIDRFILAKLESKNLAPAAAAPKSVWLRRVTFALTGLPPTLDELAAFEHDASEKSFEKVVDRLLASPAYGERWARHWLDLVRYAESRGHEHDPDIPNAWLYRDYVVRAFNDDVPFDQFAFEHLTGDVPGRRSRIVNGVNESVIGTAFWRLGEEAHSPVDIRQDQADRFDNRIDVFGKTFLGLTIACARCHDHKFDAISTKDYYALFGLLQGSSDCSVRIDGRRQNQRVADELEEFRRDLRREELAAVASKITDPHAGFEKWRTQARVVIDYAHMRSDDWLPDDVTFGSGPHAAGSIRVIQDHAVLEDRSAAVFDRFWAGLKVTPESGTESGSLGQRPRAGFTIRTPSFIQEKKGLFALVRGGGVAYAAVCGHTLITGPLHSRLVMKFVDSPDWRWLPITLTDYHGQRLHLEFTADPATDFAVALVVQADQSPPAIPPPDRQFDKLPDDLASSLAKRITTHQKELINRAVWQSRVVPAVQDGLPVDEHIFIRGNTRTQGELVPHRGLEALFGPAGIKQSVGSGRLEFANQICDPKLNPLLTRVLVNRLWHHLFGRGIVASTDNFGVLGERPTHPELLDYLATEFAAGGYKIKPFLKRLVLSQTYRMSSAAVDDPRDPSNHLLHHFRIKRLEGEAIRDAVLAVSGRLDRSVGGPPVPIHLTEFLDGRGRPKESGPLDGDGRRSLYLAVRRNFLSPFLLAFDTPIPQGTVGTRQVSNVPAQALILMNDPFVYDQAKVWGTAIAKNKAPIDNNIALMFRQAFSRPPTEDELKACRENLGAKPDAAVWADLAHSLFNVKEFRYVP